MPFMGSWFYIHVNYHEEHLYNQSNHHKNRKYLYSSKWVPQLYIQWGADSYVITSFVFSYFECIV